MDDKVRKHSLGCFGVYGDEPTLDQKGLMLWRGAEVPDILKDHPSIEYWQKTKLDIKNPKHRELILEYLTTPEGGKVEGKTVQSFQMYKWVIILTINFNRKCQIEMSGFWR